VLYNTIGTIPLVLKKDSDVLDRGVVATDAFPDVKWASDADVRKLVFTHRSWKILPMGARVIVVRSTTVRP
jgi:hypothetical protein